MQSQTKEPAIAPQPTHVYPGSWIFNRRTLGWLSEASLRRQLPLLYRLFGLYSHLYFANTDQTHLKGGRALFLAIAQGYRRWVQLGSATRPFLTVQLPQYTIVLNPLDPRFLQVVHELRDEQSDTRILSHLLSAGDTFIDLGANHGSFAVVASQLVGAAGYVVAVEPQPWLAQAVELSLRANALCRFEVYQTALGNTTGNIELLIPKDTSGSAGQYAAHSGTHDYETVTVPIQPLDTLVDGSTFPGQVVLKLDVEGSEYAVLVGAKQMIMARKPTLILEVHPGTLKASETLGEDLKSLLQDLGYQTYADLYNICDKLPVDDLEMTQQRNIVLSQ
ncbi:MAG: FkbM family methyltransferase [Thermosynechococcaceae cyanobacterium]